MEWDTFLFTCFSFMYIHALRKKFQLQLNWENLYNICFVYNKARKLRNRRYGIYPDRAGIVGFL